LKLKSRQIIIQIKPNLNVKLKVNDYTSENAILIMLNHINIDSENNDEYVYKIINKDGKNYAVKNCILKLEKIMEILLKCLKV